MLRAELRLPSRDGLDLSDPDNLEAAFQARDLALAQAWKALREEANNPRYITVHGQPLQKQAPQWKRGDLRLFHGTWAAARAEVGWVICDGRSGTPQFHPNPEGTGTATYARYLKAAATGARSGTVSGSTTHGHTFTQPSAHDTPSVSDHSVDFSNAEGHDVSSISDHNLTHDHSNNGATQCESQGAVQACCGSVCVAPACHTHPYQDSTETALTGSEGAHSGTLTHTGTQSLTHTVTYTGTHSGGAVADGVTDPPAVTVIMLMKV